MTNEFANLTFGQAALKLTRHVAGVALFATPAALVYVATRNWAFVAAELVTQNLLMGALQRKSPRVKHTVALLLGF